MELVRRTLTGYARHPNFYAVVSIGLGCEANQLNTWMGSAKLKISDKLQAFTIQEKGGTTKSVRDGIARVKELLPEANRVQREPVPASHLVLGLECGGSDGYSGISANPAPGASRAPGKSWGGGAEPGIGPRGSPIPPPPPAMPQPVLWVSATTPSTFG